MALTNAQLSDQLTRLEGKVDLLSDNHDTLVRRLDKMDLNGSTAAIKQLAGCAPQLTLLAEYAPRLIEQIPATPEAQILEEIVRTRLPLMIKFVEKAQPLLDDLDQAERKKVFWQEVARRVRWNRVKWIVGLAVSALIGAGAFQVVSHLTTTNVPHTFIGH